MGIITARRFRRKRKRDRSKKKNTNTFKEERKERKGRKASDNREAYDDAAQKFWPSYWFDVHLFPESWYMVAPLTSLTDPLAVLATTSSIQMSVN